VSHEITEHIEHAAHDPHQGSLTRWIGITIAIVGVLMAVCSAQVGEARTELIATMVNETGAALEYQTVSTKYRMLQAQLQQRKLPAARHSFRAGLHKSPRDWLHWKNC